MDTTSQDDQLPLLRKISEQEDDPGLFPEEVHRLHEAGRAREALKVFRGVIKQTLDNHRRKLQEECAANPYLWLDQLSSGSPGMYTLNGVGTRLYGKHKPDEHGFYISTLWFVVLFIPVLPLGAYLVQDAEGGGWYFLAKAPLPPLAKVVRLVTAVVVLMAALSAGAGVFWTGTSTRLMVYNGHDVAVTATVGDKTVEIAPRQLRKLGRVSTDAKSFSAAVAGATVEQFEADLSEGRGGTTLYNVNGRAGIVLGFICYGPCNTIDDRLLGNGPLLFLDNVDYAFVEPPASKDVNEGSTIIDSVLYDLEDELPFVGAVALVREDISFEAARAMVDAELEINPANLLALYTATIFHGDDAEAMDRLARGARDHAPEDVEVHRYYQDCQRHGERTQELTEEYRGLATDNPDSAMHQYLYGRLLDDDPVVAEARFARALEIDPDFAYAKLALGYNKALAGSYREAEDHYRQYAAHDADSASRVFETRLRLTRLRGLSPYSAEAEKIIAETRAAGADPYWVDRIQLLLMVEQNPDRAEELLAGEIGKLAGQHDLEDTATLEKYLATEVALAAGDVATAYRRFEAVEASEFPAANIAILALTLALSDGASDDKLQQALQQHGEYLQWAEPGVLIVAIAAGRGLDYPARETLEQMTAGLSSGALPTAVLDAGIDLRDVAAVDAALSGAAADNLGYGYVAAAILLEKQGHQGCAAWNSYRERARIYLLPTQRPAWD